MSKQSKELYESLTKEYPAPWSVVYDSKYTDFVIQVVAANGDCPITMETHSGDGDFFNLRTEGALALVKFINEIYELRHTTTT